MNALDNIVKKLEALNSNELIGKVITQNQDKIEDLNKSQLERGIKSDESDIVNRITGRSTYSPNAKNASKGRIGKKYELFDTGEYYSKLKADVKSDFFQIVNTDSKDDKLSDEYGDEIKGLTEESTLILQGIVRIDLEKLIKMRLGV